MNHLVNLTHSTKWSKILQVIYISFIFALKDRHKAYKDEALYIYISFIFARKDRHKEYKDEALYIFISFIFAHL